MKNELAFQTKLVNTLNDMGAHAFKSNNRFKAGILDIHYTRMRPTIPISSTFSAFVECKFVRQATLAKIVCGPTPKQRQFAEKETAAGGVCIGLCWVQHSKNRRLWVIVRFDPCGPTRQTITCGDDGLEFQWNSHNFTSRDIARML